MASGFTRITMKIKKFTIIRNQRAFKLKVLYFLIDQIIEYINAFQQLVGYICQVVVMLAYRLCPPAGEKDSQCCSYYNLKSSMSNQFSQEMLKFEVSF